MILLIVIIRNAQITWPVYIAWPLRHNLSAFGVVTVQNVITVHYCIYSHYRSFFQAPVNDAGLPEGRSENNQY